MFSGLTQRFSRAVVSHGATRSLALVTIARLYKRAHAILGMRLHDSLEQN